MKYLRSSQNTKRKYATGGSLPSILGQTQLSSFNPLGIMSAIIADSIATHKNTDNAIVANNLQAQTAREFQKDSDRLNDASLLSSFPSKGVNSVTRYAKGGKLLPVNDKVEVAMGDSHNMDSNNDGNTGIILSLQGNPMAEIEGGEVKWDNKIFSNRIGIGDKTFADIALALTKTSAYKNASRMEDKYKETANDVRANIFKRGTARRMLEKNPNPLEVLFQMQEAQKEQKAEMEQQNAGVPQAAMGMDLATLLGKAGNVSADVVPYLDNIYNATLTANASQLPAPTRRVAPVLKTNFDINPQLNEINRDTEGLNKIITDTTASSSIANTNRIANRLQGTYAKNRILSEKQNIETQLLNQQAGVNADVTNQNSSLLDNYRLQEFSRQSDLRAEKSANVANAVEDARMARIDSNAAKLDKQRIALTAAQYLDTGVLERSQFDKIIEIIDNGGDLSEALTYMNDVAKKRKLAVPESLPSKSISINRPSQLPRPSNRWQPPQRESTIFEKMMKEGFK
jgi:hypothetical protein